MDVPEIFERFLSSDSGQQAMGALQAQGISPDDAKTFLGHATQAVTEHVNDHAQSHGLLGDSPGKSFFAAFASGLVKGDGVFGSLEDGAMGVITARVTEAICDRAGVDSGTAATIAAAATPYITSFVKSHLGG
ncbi:MAG TPA: hypothetical protein VGI39_28705 [Polyangiaceae bacterium]